MQASQINFDHDARMHRKPTMTVEEFCDDHHISKSFFYKIAAEGKGPKMMHVGRRRLITAEAAAEWRRAMESATASA